MKEFIVIVRRDKYSNECNKILIRLLSVYSKIISGYLYNYTLLRSNGSENDKLEAVENYHTNNLTQYKTSTTPLGWFFLPTDSRFNIDIFDMIIKNNHLEFQYFDDLESAELYYEFV